MSDIIQKLENTKYDPLLSDEEAAKVLGSTSASVKQSRYTGLLFGRRAPKFIKMGRSSKYRLSTLIAFVDQFQEYDNTAQFTGKGFPGKESQQ